MANKPLLHYVEDMLFLGEAEVTPLDNTAYLDKHKGTISIYGLTSSSSSKDIRTSGKTLKEILGKYPLGKELRTKDGRTFRIDYLEVDLSERELKAGKLNPYNFILYVYVKDINDTTDLDPRYIKVSMDLVSEEKPKIKEFKL